ncbi:hypothetical protein PanWU01x14_236020, partial [Parasponia andersonii]
YCRLNLDTKFYEQISTSGHGLLPPVVFSREIQYLCETIDINMNNEKLLKIEYYIRRRYKGQLDRNMQSF